MDPVELAHLLRRTEFIARPERVAALSGLTRAQAVDDVLNVALNGAVTLPVEFTEEADDGWQQYVDACSWWLDRMAHLPRPIQEKLTLFWHGHFTSGWWEVGKGVHMMRQLHLYRRYALGDYRVLTQLMALEPAMLVYLSNANSVKGKPNQNFARELMELFTLGVGNYSEADVEAAARAWTGHNALWPDYEYVFRADQHDTGNKTFFGTTKNWDGPDIIDEILRDNPAKRLVAARFVTRKLWEFLAHPSPPQALVERLADEFLASDLSLRALVRAILLADEFYTETARRGLVRTPIEYMAALVFHTGLGGDELGAAWAAEAMGQQMYQPPNVSGWRHNGYWLTTSAVNGRAVMAQRVTWYLRSDGGFDFLNTLTVDDAVDHVAAYFGIHDMSSATRAALVGAQRAERDAQRWASWWAPTNLLTMTMLTPEFQMA